MASFDPIIRMNDNVFRGPEKIKSKAGRKPLGDVTNSSKPLGKNKVPGKTFTEFKGKGPEKVQPKVRKPLGDLTNSQRPAARENKVSKKNNVEVSAVSELKVYDWVKEEGFLHNHNECLKAKRQSANLSIDYYFETIGLKKDSSVSSLHTTQIHSMSTASNCEIETELELFEIPDISSPPASRPTSKAPGSPCWSDSDWESLNFSPLKLKDSPARN